MAVYATATETFQKAPAGQYQAVCCELVDLGVNRREFKNKETGGTDVVTQQEYQYVFQLNKLDDNGRRFEIRSAPFALKLSEKANLRKFLLSWRGHDLTEAEKVPPGVDIDLTGRNAIISVVHNAQGDKTFANIGSIMPVMEGMPLIEPLDYKPKQAAIDKAKAESSGQTQEFSGQQTAAAAIPANVGVAAGKKEDIPF